MSCVDCHNPHGSFLPHNVQTVDGQRARLFQVPRRTWRVRSLSSMPPMRLGRLHGVPHAARLAEHEDADAQSGAVRVPGVPLEPADADGIIVRDDRKRPTGVSQFDVSEVPELHGVPPDNTRLLRGSGAAAMRIVIRSLSGGGVRASPWRARRRRRPLLGGAGYSTTTFRRLPRRRLRPRRRQPRARHRALVHG